MKYGDPPVLVHWFTQVDLREVMYYLYLPVKMPGSGLVVPHNVRCCYPLIYAAWDDQYKLGRSVSKESYIYLSARKGWATPDNPLNRPGWHCDGFGTQDSNYVWWRGAGTRFAEGNFGLVPHDHIASLKYFEHVAPTLSIHTYPDCGLYRIDPGVVHATPQIAQGQWRQYVKVSFSTERYNLENNSHNYGFEYDWPLTPRSEIRNDTYRAQRDYA